MKIDASIARPSYEPITPASSARATSTDEDRKPIDATKDQQMQREIRKAQQVEQKVIAHEQAHMQAGGNLAGGATYQYTQGPDGKKYITGGEVSISLPRGKTPEETLRLMAQVQRAALAPADPSPQDLRVAAQAAAKSQEARAELQMKQLQANNPYSKNNDTGAGLYSQLLNFG
jgi:hypothetical protein